MMKNDAIDAEICFANTSVNSELNYENCLNNEVLLEIQEDLEKSEIISIIFLMADDHKNIFDEVLQIVKKNNEILEFVKLRPYKWKAKLIEALCIIENYEVLRKLRFSRHEIAEIKKIYFPRNVNTSVNINKIIKYLYITICKDLNMNETNKLLSLVYDGKKKPQFDSILELHIWYWMQQNYITVTTDNANLELLKKCLSRVSIEIYTRFVEKWGSNDMQNTKDCEANVQTFNRIKGIDKINNIQRNNNLSLSSSCKEGMCIIINEVNFKDKYPTRIGSDKDCNSLSETFTGMGFEVISYNDQTSNEMKRILGSCKKYADRKCLVVCILSHGDEKGIIFEDGEKVTLDDIDNIMCRKELRNVFKFLIVQSCQGKEVGVPAIEAISSKLTSDGPHIPTPSLLDRKNFVLLKASLKGFIAMRHEAEGSWFIQELCQVLQDPKEVPVKVSDLTRQVIERVSKKIGEINSQKTMQLPEAVFRTGDDYEFPLYNKKS